MLFIVGLLVVFGCVLGGYLAPGGHVDVLFQPFEFIIIFGAMIGAFIIANPKPILIGTLKSFGKILAGSKYHKSTYMQVISVMYSVFRLAKTKGDLALESHVDKPHESPIFQNYPTFLKNHHALDFFCDYLRLLTLGTSNAHEIEAVMDADLETHRHENHLLQNALQGAADGLPALGIVAAVLGVIHTMGSISEPPEVLGHLIGAALVGTFSGILFSYGLMAPMAQSLGNILADEVAYLECIKTGLIAHMQGYAPQVSIEFARKTLHPHVRPTFQEVDEMIQNIQA